MPLPRAIVRRPVCTVHDDTADLDLPLVLSARVSLGYDLRIAEAEVVLPAIPDGLHYFDQITITLGATAQTAWPRFVGYLVEFDRELWPRQVTLVLRGRLVLADQMDNPAVNGTDLVGGGTGATDADIVTAVLAACGISGGAVDIAGTSKTLGTIATKEFLWGNGETALSYIERVDQVCLGQRTFDGPDGIVHRTAVSTVATHDLLLLTMRATGGTFRITVGASHADLAYDVSAADLLTALGTLYGGGAGGVTVIGTPGVWYEIRGHGATTADPLPTTTASDTALSGPGHGVSLGHVTFTEGVDIFRARGQTAILPARNRVVVTGFTAQGSTFAPFTNTQQATNASIPTPPTYLTYQFSSRLIEKSLTADGTAGVGISAEEVAGWFLAEYKHQQVKLSMQTPRDVLLLPGDPIEVVAPVRLATNTRMVVQRADMNIDEHGQWSQDLTTLSGPEEG